MLRRESRAIARVIRAQRDRLLAKVDPTVVAVQHAVFLATHDHTDLAEHEALYREPYIVRDVLNYRAAAIALYRVGADLWPEGIAVPPKAFEARMSPPPEERIHALRNWRGLFSPSGAPYRSLDRTLMNLPSAIPVYLTCYLRSVKLERPIVSPLVLKAVLYRVANACDSIGRAPSVVAANQIRILQHATEDELRGAVAHVAVYTGSPLNNNRHVRQLVQLISDYPEPHHGRLGGLLKKAIRWDKCRYCNPQILQEVLDELDGAATPTARPPIPPPAVPGITFLSTVGEIIEEGVRMRHCIAEEASSAVDGHSHFFHIERHGELASIEVDSDGEVTQASGPRNCQNGATRWGAMWLRIWGRKLHPMLQRTSMTKSLCAVTRLPGFTTCQTRL